MQLQEQLPSGGNQAWMAGLHLQGNGLVVHGSCFRGHPPSKYAARQESIDITCGSKGNHTDTRDPECEASGGKRPSKGLS
ncbi:predicted protein [Histoplasma mississippiense (nom. inval.)]|uniref:predicted protein n=1 Tax=Ajellomyces capsulatus (strain NAm1 / WU24) TaxID=2059318 RepID=UPI000157BE12|nr:predicted protein [Histoplasma mississippiense (nom. inval.)]EDN06082.1 predicted protein [Histoplasma mississippiense (nom. inval.)]